jgi:cold shock CspA family protein
MKTLSSIILVPALAAALLTGCDASLGYRHVHYDPNAQPPDDNGGPVPPDARPDTRSDTGGRHVREIRGTVVRVDPRDQSILLSPADSDNRDDRDGREAPGRDRDLVLHYNDDTRVEYEGQAYGPENLEPGDQIDAVVERGSEGLVTEAIRVLSDVRGGPEREDQREDRDDHPATDLEGVVRSNDTSRHTVEIERAGRGERSEVVVVHYDDDTQVEFQGRSYGPENLERGDAVEIELRDDSRRPVAERIVVVGEGRRVRS